MDAVSDCCGAGPELMETGPSLRRIGGVFAAVEAGGCRRLREDDAPPVAFRESCLSDS